MVKRHSSAQGRGARKELLPALLGRRLRLRRSQLGMRPHIVASHLGVSPEDYVTYETGQTLIPAEHLAELAQLLRVPMFYFFRDVPISDDKTVAPESKPTPAFSITTEADRIVSLVGDFQKLDFERQQHLLLLAGALVRDAAAG